MYKVRLSLEAEKVFATSDKALAKKLARCFNNLENSPRSHPNIKPLKGSYSGYYRYRVGDYRVVYSIEDELVMVTVIIIAHRSKVYE
ncbi:MAG: type II toxin-antitoxin system RelE/ParE family toxin [Cyanobacteria bacterium P01_G01_bin.39]